MKKEISNLKKNFDLICIIMIFMCSNVITAVAQDFDFSLYKQNRTYFNPAYSGMHKGLVQSNFIYRRKWLNFPGNFSTKHFNADWKKYNSHSFGVSILSDIEGESFLTTNSFGLNYSWRGTLNKITNSFFQLGLRASYDIKKININKLTFSDQIDKIYGKIYNSSFVSDQNKRDYIDFSIGGLVNFSTEGVWGNVFTHTFGLALHHFTRPNESFQGQKFKLPVKFTFHGSSEYKTRIHSINREDNLRITPWFLYEIKGDQIVNTKSSNNLLVGINFSSDPIIGGISYRTHLNSNSINSNSLVFQFGIHLYTDNKNLAYRIFYAYDLGINNYTKYTRNTHEIAFSIAYSFKQSYKCINNF